MKFQGKTAVITGGGSGLGAAMADLFAGAGARVVLLDIDAALRHGNGCEVRNRNVSP